MFHTVHFKMVLIPDKGKITPEGHYEFLDILYNMLLNHTLVNIFVITFTYLFYIDKIQSIFILEHHYSPPSLFSSWYCLRKVIGQKLLTPISLFFHQPHKCINRKMLLGATSNIVIAFRQGLCLTQNSRMVCKRNC